MGSRPTFSPPPFFDPRTPPITETAPVAPFRERVRSDDKKTGMEKSDLDFT